MTRDEGQHSIWTFSKVVKKRAVNFSTTLSQKKKTVGKKVLPTVPVYLSCFTLVLDYFREVTRADPTMSVRHHQSRMLVL